MRARRAAPGLALTLLLAGAPIAPAAQESSAAQPAPATQPAPAPAPAPATPPAPAPASDAPPAPVARIAQPPPGVSVDGPVDLQRLLQVTRLREAMTSKLVSSYTFRQTTTEEELTTDGALKDRQVRVYQVLPTPHGTERHLIGKDGRDPTPEEIRKQEKRNESVQKRLQKMRERAAREAARKEQRRTASPAPAAARRPPAAQASAAPAPVPSPSPVPPPATASSAVDSAAASSREDPVTPENAAPAPDPATGMPAGTENDRPAAAVPPVPPVLAPLPACDFTDPLSSVRPPLPGSVTRSRAPALAASEATRRRRERASDYSLFELLNLTDHELAGACTWEGRPMHLVAFRPPAGFDPLNPVERVMGAMKGTILIDGSDLEVARAEGEIVAPITWGAGMVKLKSAHVVLEYGRVQGELWLPRRDVFELATRVFFDHDRYRVTHEFDDFRKAQVETEFEFGGPVED